MLEQFATDIIEDDLLNLEKSVLDVLLFDRSTRRNIIWATDDYSFLGEEYQRESEIKTELITGKHTYLIQPRTAKTIDSQENRIRDKAEVFTPSWVCNQQNNLVDDAWFGKSNVFNAPKGSSWVVKKGNVNFPQAGSRTWKRYVDVKRLEVSCGEAPYLVSRYDSTNGKRIPMKSRIGLLDRKLRVVNENTGNKDDWINWAVRALQSVYGFEFQGDSLFLARENVFVTFLEYYYVRYDELPPREIILLAAKIVSWNLWQMDGVKFVVPYSCKPQLSEDITLFGTDVTERPCPGCKNGDHTRHTGIYCKVMDWREKQSFLYADLMKGKS